jgi:hypothetical protein
MKRIALAALAAGVWINVSEFLRNETLFKGHWLAKYETLGLEFPSAPVNGALWGLWGFTFAGCIIAVRRQNTFLGTIALCWTLGFVLMWIVIGNLNVLPLGLLPIAVPWSLAEVALAVVLVQSIMKNPESNKSVDGTR